MLKMQWERISRMNLWHISQKENNTWDTYDSAIVAAETEEEACQISPVGGYRGCLWKPGWKNKDWSYGWASHPDKVTAKYIGKAKEGIKKGVILSSFNAG